MYFANILPTFSRVEWVITIMLLIVCFFVVRSDIISRQITNKKLIIIFILACTWNAYRWEIPTWDTILQVCFILGSGYMIYASGIIGAGDIKLSIVLSLFFLNYHSPFIFLGNIAVITLVFLSGYIMGSFLALMKNAHLRYEIRSYLCKQWDTNETLIALRNIRNPSRRDQDKYKNIFHIFGIWIGIILAISLIKYAIHTYRVGLFPWLHILTSGTGTVLLFFLGSPLLRKIYTGPHQAIGIFITIFSTLLLIAKAAESGTMMLLLEHLIQTTIMICLLGILYRIVRGLYSLSLIFFDRRVITVSEIGVGDMLNIPANTYLYKHLIQETKNPLFAFKTTKQGPTLTVTPRIQRQLHNLAKRYPIQELYVQRTLPYAVFIIGGFCITLFTNVHLAGSMMKFFQN